MVAMRDYRQRIRLKSSTTRKQPSIVHHVAEVEVVSDVSGSTDTAVYQFTA